MSANATEITALAEHRWAEAAPAGSDPVSWQDGYAHGYDEGQRATLELRQATGSWDAVPLRWCHIAAGDTLVGHDLQLLRVLGSYSLDDNTGNAWRLVIEDSAGHRSAYDGDREETANVLCLAAERDAFITAREQGFVMMEGRTT